MVASGEWKIMDITASSEEKTYSCCTEPFSQLSYTFTLKRLPKYVLLYLVCPCIAIILLSVLSFVIPADSGERVGYGVTILLTMGVFLLGVSSELPKRSDAAPMLSIAYNTLFYVLMLSFAVSTINSYLIRKSTKPPETLSTLALKLVRKQRRAESFGSMIDDNGVSALLPENGNRQSMKSKRPTLKEEIEIKPMLEAKRSLGHSLAFGKEDQSDYEKQWRALANMSDKLFGYVFAAILLFTILIVFIIIVKRS